VVQLLLKQARDDGATLLMATHDYELMSRFDRVVNLEGGTGAEPGGDTP
jgi:ABC-type lipoprotein export system ATPase subunit